MPKDSKLPLDSETAKEPSMPCVYCGSHGPFTDEHVLARAFAGPGEDWMLIDLVCGACNKLFSTYERAWTSSAIEGTARIKFGPPGRRRADRAYEVHPSEDIFLVSPDDPVCYEVDILRDMVPRLRPQLVCTTAGMSLHASDDGDLARFKKALGCFFRDRELTIRKRPLPGPAQFWIAVLSGGDTFAVERVELRGKPAPAWLDRFPAGLPGISKHPRVSVDTRGRLRVRAASLRQAAQTFTDTLAQETIASTARSFEVGQYHLAIRLSYDIGMVHRAVAKTLVNYAVDAMGPKWISAPEFRPILDYCLGRIEAPSSSPFVEHFDKRGIKELDATVTGVHALSLACNGIEVIGLIKLYGGPTYHVRLGIAPADTMPFIRTVWIDYNGRGRVPPFTYPPLP